MKKLFVSLLLLLLLLPGMGQQRQSDFRSVGLSAGASIIGYSYRGYAEPFVTWGYKNKQLLVAPTLLITSNLGYQSPQKPRLTGTRIGYRFKPSPNEAKWKLYLAADLRLQRLSDRWLANSFNETKQNYKEYSVQSVELLLENYFGYGLEFSVGKSFVINQGIGLGWYYSDLKTRPDSNYGMVNDFFDYRGYDNVGFIWNINLGVSYRL